MLLKRAAHALHIRLASGKSDSKADLRSSARSESGLEALIPPEIIDDAFACMIEEIASNPDVREILEIGSSTGEGSTAAWVRGALQNPHRPRLHCIEVSTERYAALVEMWGDEDFVHCHHVSSVPVERLASAAAVERFYRNVPSRLREFELTTVGSELPRHRRRSGRAERVRHLRACCVTECLGRASVR